MATTMQLVIKSGPASVGKQVPAQVKLGWALYGDPFEYGGELAQEMHKVGDSSTEDVEYVVVMRDGMSTLEAQCTALKAAGYAYYGSPCEVGGLPVQVMIKGNMPIEQGAGGGGGSGGTIVAADITDATAVGRNVLKAADQGAARTAIGAGTSNLAIGTTNTTAKAGNYAPSSTEVGNALKAKAQITALTALADPATATAPDIATKLNAVIAALQA